MNLKNFLNLKTTLILLKVTGKIEMTSYIPDNISESEGKDEPEYYDDIPPKEEWDYDQQQ